MLSLWQRFCFHRTIAGFSRTSRVTHARERPGSLWALRDKFKGHGIVQQWHRSLVKIVRHECFQAHNGIFVKPGDTIELEDGVFLRVKEVLHYVFSDRYWLIGWKFTRNEQTLGLPGNDPNEVYWVVHLTKNDSRPAVEQALVRVDVAQILRKRVMIMVNKTYPTHQGWPRADLRALGEGVLYCRWKHVVVTKKEKLVRLLDAFSVPAAEIDEASFQRLCAEDFDYGRNTPIADGTLCQSRLDGKGRECAHIGNDEPNSLSLGIKALSLDDNSRKVHAPAAYTFADVCCGGGGASRGAELAGFKLRWALDHNADACETYRLNFPQVRLYHKPLNELANMWRKDLKVDIMHISPPCQAFSQVNTSPNLSNDTLNIAANMEIGSCLDIARPRIATLEQTSGLMSLGYAGGKHSQHWGKIISQFTCRNYSIAWKTIDLAELGLPQRRKRLLMIASRYVCTHLSHLPYHSS